MDVRRREVIKGIPLAVVAPFVHHQEDENTVVEKPYDEPFKGYSEYIVRLRQHVGEEVAVQRSFNIIQCGSSDKLTGLARITDNNPKLFPHAVSFDNGSTINLRSIASITRYGILQSDVDPTVESTFYLDIPGKKANEEASIRFLESLEEQDRRYG